MRLSTFALTLILCAGSILCAGCSILPEPKPAVYIPAGTAVEVAKYTQVEVWITNEKTGLRERVTIEVQPGYLIGRPALKEDKPVMEAAPIAAKE